MVFINRTRHIIQILVHTSGCRVCSRAKETTVVPVITVDGHNLREIAEELSIVGQQLDLVAVICTHSDDASARITIGFEEEALDVIDGTSRCTASGRSPASGSHTWSGVVSSVASERGQKEN